ncbi:PTS sugar transporter subunit IIA [Sphingomonas japonica]|uniref:PTS system nitrogen regulatory IIA component n=1 Tax=Sphingomonas japonica TaxID=511662 RepID=A0ABX0TYZ5_9SPHN|nr:PTS sugar transporter subunit IIA [Sphingomonas japonica]NIJ23469.1 PTS system nitrogen regulatory IIA component [Sphingomonas japonica]
MTDLADLIQPDAVRANLSVASKKALFAALSDIAAAQIGGDAAAIQARLAEREKLGSTGFGGGIAIPHARVEGIDHVAGVFVRLVKPLDFKAVDDLPVDLVFMLISPAAAGAEHLKALALVSRRLRDRGFAAKLRGAGLRDAIYALLTAGEARDAA